MKNETIKTIQITNSDGDTLEIRRLRSGRRLTNASGVSRRDTSRPMVDRDCEASGLISGLCIVLGVLLVVAIFISSAIGEK